MQGAWCRAAIAKKKSICEHFSYWGDPQTPLKGAQIFLFFARQRGCKAGGRPWHSNSYRRARRPNTHTPLHVRCAPMVVGGQLLVGVCWFVSFMGRCVMAAWLFVADRLVRGSWASQRGVVVPGSVRVRVLARGRGPGPRNVLVVGPKGIPFVTTWRSVVRAREGGGS